MKRIISLLLIFALAVPLFANKPYRVGTTAGNFLEIGFSAAGNAMGDAAVASVNDLSALYWNPAMLAHMEQSEAQFMYQPWFADINTAMAAVGVVAPSLGTFAIGFYQVDYGEMNVTTVQMQEGTGEHFSAKDYCLSLSFGRKLVQWFSFGASAKYIASNIWHMKASAMAVDLGVAVNTEFFSPTGNRSDGLTIGMSISNYGTRMKFDGMDLMQPIDLLPNEHGNYKYAEGQLRTQGWELPLIFRIGAALHPISTANHRFTIEMDALHPNNNAESINLGAQYELNMPTFGTFYLRGGYKALFLPESEFGPSFGGGLVNKLMNNIAIKVDYAYRDIGPLGSIHCYSLGILF